MSLLKSAIIAASTTVLTAVASVTVAQTMTLNTPAASDLSGSTSANLANVALPRITENRDSVAFSYVLGDQPLMFDTLGASKVSRSFAMEMSGEQLQKGVFIPTRSNEPVVRIIPMVGASPLNAGDLKVETHRGKVKNKDAFKNRVNARELSEAGLASAPNSFAMRMKADTRRGFTLSTDATMAANSRYKIMVLESNSEMALELSLERNRVVQGQAIVAEAQLQNGNQPMAIDTVTAFVQAPGSARKQAVTAKVEQGRVVFDMDTSDMIADQPGLWELSLQTGSGRGKNKVLRDAKIAFAVAPATAALGNSAEMIADAQNGEDLSFSLPVDVTVAGRYELQAVIFGQDVDGNQVPGVQVMAAKWLEANGSITLTVPASQLQQAGIQAPFTVSYLKLKDQSRLSELWSQESALTLP